MTSSAQLLRRSALASVLLIGGVACLDRSTGPQTGRPATVTKQVETDNQSALPGAAVPIPPAVVVRDASGNPLPRVSVTFQVASGGGHVSGATSETNWQGVATVGSWTLGPAAGPNTLRVIVPGIDPHGTNPVLFTATGAAPTSAEPASIAKRAETDGQSAAVGTAVAAPPSVVVRDANDDPLSGVVVTFAVIGGGGSITGASAETDGQGVATVGSWTLGTTLGENSLSATVGSLSAVTFTATAVVGAPAQIAKLEGDGQEARVGAGVSYSPIVLVTDAYGHPVPDVPVTFAVLSGGGSVHGSPATTNQDGKATVWSWMLGPTPGLNELRASVAGSASPVTFTATALDACTVAADLAVNTGVLDELTTIDCDVESFYTDFYVTSLDAQAAVVWQMSDYQGMGMFDPAVEVYDASGNLVAFNDNYWSLDARVFLIAAPGTYSVRATSAWAGQTGQYLIWPEPVAGSVDGCAEAWVMRGVTTAQALDAGDCFDASDGTYADRTRIALKAGQQVTITMQSPTLDANLRLYDESGAVVALDGAYGGRGDAQIIFTPTADGIYVIEPRSAQAGETGAYTLTIQ